MAETMAVRKEAIPLMSVMMAVPMAEKILAKNCGAADNTSQYSVVMNAYRGETLGILSLIECVAEFSLVTEFKREKGENSHCKLHPLLSMFNWLVWECV